MLLGKTVSICLVVSAFGIFGAAAQDQSETVTLDDLLSSAQDWARKNLDDDALRSLQAADRQKVQQVLKEFQTRFQGEYILDLAGLKEAAQQAVALLESYPETMPYALWLKNR